MAKLKLIDNKGKAQGDLELADVVFKMEPNKHLLYLATVRQNANARAGTAKVKTRMEVRGGGAKPWKQKGTGNARAGSRRSPLWVGGGQMHGPTPNVNWTKGMNKKEKIVALKSALSLRLENTTALKDTGIKEGKTKEFVALLDALKLSDKKTLFIVGSEDKDLAAVKRASGNIVLVKTITNDELNVKDILSAEEIIITESAAKAVELRLSPVAVAA